MCTVTYIPTTDNSFIFTSNRDEAPTRSAKDLMRKTQDDKLLLYPRDPQANGTWFAISNQHQLVCILNGAFERHERQPPYRLSRGIMALQFFDYSSTNDFFENFDFAGMESFTMIIFDSGKLFELRWDEQQKHPKELDVQTPHLWASATLYTPALRQQRQEWFTNWLDKNPIITPSSVLDFHKNGGTGDARTRMVMNYDNLVRTTSVTSVVKNINGFDFRFEDLLTGDVRMEQIEQG